MEDPIDASFYLGKQASNLDVPLSNGEIVSINLAEELPEDSNELISFLETENCPRKYWISVAIAYAQLNKLDESSNVIKTAMGLAQFTNEDKVAFHSYLVWLHLKFVSNGVNKEENLNKASEELNQVSHLDNTKSNISALLANAVLSLYKDQVEPALEIFDRLLKIDSSNCFALLGKAQVILNKTKNYANALKLYQQVLILNPLMKPDPRIGIGLCFWFLKDESMAISAWKRALEIDPENLKAKILLNLASFNINFNSSLSDKDFQASYEDCLKALADNYKKNSNDAVILLSLATYYFSRGDHSLVEKICNKVIQIISGNSSTASSKLYGAAKVSKFQSNLLSQAALWLGRVSFAKSDFMQSQKYFHEAIKLNENNLLAKLGLGQSQINRGSKEEAIITYESILKTNSKCLEVNYSLGVLYANQNSKRKQEQGIAMLEKYLRLAKNLWSTSSKLNDEDLESLNQEPVALNAYLILSKLYETKDINQSLNYLNKAIESRKQINKDAPLEVYNNIGVFNFIKHNYDAAAQIFETASEKLNTGDDFKDENGDVLMDLRDDLKVTINYNLARSKELTNESESIKVYETLLSDCPNYFSAKLRLLFLDCVSTNKSTKEEIKQEIENLLQLNASDLEIRSFYGWFVKTFGKKLNMKPDADTKHQKDTLVEFDSHDCYALLSLANIYCIMARDIKGLNNDEKKKKYYIRAIELFTKVLSVDPHNVFGAQGLAIVYIENKESNKGLDILRKIRDSLNDISVYLNLGHVLLDLKQYSKAIENYEIALMRYANDTDSKILSFLGRAWLARGLSEKNLTYLYNALSYAEKALLNATGAKSSLRFNIAYIQFQLAEFISKVPLEQRLVEDIEKGIENLNAAIETLNSLSSDDEKHPPYPKSELKARANLGTSTLLNRLNACLDETIDSVKKSEIRLEEAKKLREQEAAQLLKEEEERKAKEREIEQEMAKERAKLQEQAQQWAEEARMNVVVDEENDDKLFEKESNIDEKKKKSKKSSAKQTKQKKKGRKKNVVSDSEEEDAPSPSEDESDGDNDLKRKGDGDDESEDKSSKKRKVSKLSKETIEDSDDELDDDLFNDEGDKGDEQQNDPPQEENADNTPKEAQDEAQIDNEIQNE